MKYTIRNGVVRPFSEHISDNARFILPLLIILAGVLFFMLGPRHAQSPQHPLTLGIYTVKTPNQNSGGSKTSSDTSGGPSSGSGAVALTGQSPVTPISLGTSSTTASSTPSPAVSPVTTGGMGGGGGGTPVVTCDNSSGLLPITCLACAPALVVPVGQKVLLSTDGSCSLLN
jgi:hypothetical protein